MQNATKANEGPWTLPWLIWCGLVVFCVGEVFESAVIGTVFGKRLGPNALLGAWLLILAGFAMYLLGYRGLVTKAGLPSQSAILTWTALGGLLFCLGWANLRGAMNHLVTESQRDLLVNSGVLASLPCFVIAIGSLIRYSARLSPEQRTLWQQTYKWPGIVLVLALIVGLAISLITWFWLEPDSV
jgi:hypothetical protein